MSETFTQKMALLIADLSYIVFHTYYALLKFYKSYFNKDPDIANLMNSPLFTSKFRKMFARKIVGIAAEYRVALADVVFAVDCDRESIWRRDVFPEYKTARGPKTEFNPKAFDLTFDSIVPAMCREHGMRTLRVPRAEADDIAGVLHALVRARDRAERVVIITNDNDYIQLADEHTVIVNLAREAVADRKGADLTAAEYLVCKILCGDKSDNIPGAIPRCGMKTAEKIVRNKDRLEKALKDKDVYRRFAMNRTLMDMTQVPEPLQRSIVEQFTRARPTTAGDAAASSIRSRRPSVSCT